MKSIVQVAFYNVVNQLAVNISSHKTNLNITAFGLASEVVDCIVMTY